MVWNPADVHNFTHLRSLTNTDININKDNSFCFFARRLQTIIDKMISNEQSAYIKGSFIGMNARLVLNIYDYCMENNSEGLILFLYFEIK